MRCAVHTHGLLRQSQRQLPQACRRGLHQLSIMCRQGAKMQNRHARPAAPRAARYAAVMSIATSFLLAALLTGYWYGFFRSCAVFPNALKYAGFIAFGVGIFSGPLLVLLG